MKSVLNHVAILVENLELILEKKFFPADQMGKIEEFPSEGTKELYIGRDDQVGKLLLMQAIGEGPYKRAFKKRGAGLHHIALDVLDIDDYLNNVVSGSGWLLHPESIGFYKNNKQVYLSRPGVPTLIEVQETNKLVDDNGLIKELHFPFKETRLLDGVNCDRLKDGDEIKFKINNDFFGQKLWS